MDEQERVEFMNRINRRLPRVKKKQDKKKQKLVRQDVQRRKIQKKKREDFLKRIEERLPLVEEQQMKVMKEIEERNLRKYVARVAKLTEQMAKKNAKRAEKAQKKLALKMKKDKIAKEKRDKKIKEDTKKTKIREKKLREAAIKILQVQKGFKRRKEIAKWRIAEEIERNAKLKKERERIDFHKKQILLEKAQKEYKTKEARKKRERQTQQKKLLETQERDLKKLRPFLNKKNELAPIEIRRAQVAIRSVKSSSDNVLVVNCAITKKQMDEIHHKKFPSEQIQARGEDNCDYLSRMFGLSGKYRPVKLVGEGVFNTVYKAVSPKVTTENKNMGVVIRVSRIGNTDIREISFEDFSYSYHINVLAYRRLVNSGVHIPMIRSSEVQKIDENTHAGVQVQDFIQGTTLSDAVIYESSFKKRYEIFRQYGRTLGVMHEGQLAHGDAHAGNFMVRDKDNSKYLVPVDLDRCVDMSNLKKEQHDHCVKYDLVMAYTACLRLCGQIINIRSKEPIYPTEAHYIQAVTELRDHFFRAFTESYLYVRRSPTEEKLWEKIPHNNRIFGIDYTQEQKHEFHMIVNVEWRKYSTILEEQKSIFMNIN